MWQKIYNELIVLVLVEYHVLVVIQLLQFLLPQSVQLKKNDRLVSEQVIFNAITFVVFQFHLFLSYSFQIISSRVISSL